MSHQILMLGGRRAGKSTILATVMKSLKDMSQDIKNRTGYDIVIEDTTDYENATITTAEGRDQPLPSLISKYREIAGFILDHRDMGTNLFTVDMDPTPGKGTYSIKFTISENNGNGMASINFDFIDVPGEWMRRQDANYRLLIDEIGKADVFIIAIDTPFLMLESSDPQTQQEYDQINNIYNRIGEIIESLNQKIRFGGEDQNSQSAGDEDRKLILLCPIKCEKWFYQNKMHLVTEKVKHDYDELIAKYVNDRRVTIKIMPIQTAGGLESVTLLPAKLLYRRDNQAIGESCSVDPNTDMILLRNGLTIQPNDAFKILPDDKWKIDYFNIPLSWYKVNGKGATSKFCEQPAYHIIEFLIDKEDRINHANATNQQRQLAQQNWFRRFFTRIFHPTFGRYLPLYRNFTNKLSQSNFIKRSGDGFELVQERLTNNI